jgi:hypothetical protein
MDDRRRLSFGGVAELYDRSRPSYPEALVDGVLEFAGVGTGAGVGAGTRAGAGERAEYLALLGTHSACVVLGAPERERLLGDIAAAIDARGGGFRMTYVTVLFLARAS